MPSVMVASAGSGFGMECALALATQGAIQAVVEQNERIDALVQFAGMGLRGFFEDRSLEEVRQVYDLNISYSLRRIVTSPLRQATTWR